MKYHQFSDYRFIIFLFIIILIIKKKQKKIQNRIIKYFYNKMHSSTLKSLQGEITCQKGAYQLETVLGQGAFACVFKAKLVKTGEVHAIKILSIDEIMRKASEGYIKISDFNRHIYYKLKYYNKEYKIVYFIFEKDN